MKKWINLRERESLETENKSINKQTNLNKYIVTFFLVLCLVLLISGIVLFQKSKVNNQGTEDYLTDTQDSHNYKEDIDPDAIGLMSYKEDDINESNPFYSKTLIIESNKDINEISELGNVVSYANNLYLIQFDSEEEAEKAYETLQEDETLGHVEPNSILRIATSDSSSSSNDALDRDAVINMISNSDTDASVDDDTYTEIVTDEVDEDEEYENDPREETYSDDDYDELADDSEEFAEFDRQWEEFVATQNDNDSNNSNNTTENPRANKVKNDIPIVAVIDSGIDLNSSLFTDRIINLGDSANYTSEENDIQDTNGHGTSVASIIAENSEAKLLPIKIADEKGYGTVYGLYQAILTAIDNNVDIINISLTATADSQLLVNAIEKADKAGIKIVVAAGNNSANVENYAPANMSEVITIAALNQGYTVAEYSNYGSEIDYAVVGTEIEVEGLNGKETKSGTSLSAALATAIIANIISEDADANIDEQLNNYVTKIQNMESDYYGKGILSLDPLAVDYEIDNSGFDFKIRQTVDDDNEDIYELEILKTTTEDVEYTFDGGNSWQSDNSISIDRKDEFFDGDEYFSSIRTLGIKNSSGDTVFKNYTVIDLKNRGGENQVITLAEISISSYSEGTTSGNNAIYDPNNTNMQQDYYFFDFTIGNTGNSKNNTSNTAILTKYNTYNNDGNVKIPQCVYVYYNGTKFYLRVVQVGNGTQSIFRSDSKLDKVSNKFVNPVEGAYPIWVTRAKNNFTIQGSYCTKINDHALEGAVRLKNVTIPKTVTSLGDYSLAGMNYLSKLTLGKGITTLPAKLFGDAPAEGATDTRTKITNRLTIQGTLTNTNGALSNQSFMYLSLDNSITSIADEEFKNCGRLIEVRIPNNTTTIGKSAFEGCKKLRTVNFGKALNIKTIGEAAFKDCINLENLKFSSLKNVTTIEQNTFSNTAFRTITIPDNVTLIKSGAFNNCARLYQLTIGLNVEEIYENAFTDSGFIKATTYTSSKNRRLIIKSQKALKAHGNFQNMDCKTISIQGKVPSIEDAMFSGCKTITNITVPNGLTSIGKEAFKGCESLKYFTMMNTPKLQTIGESAFEGCKNLINTRTCSTKKHSDGSTEYTYQNKRLPNSVRTIGDYAFKGCNLQSVMLGTGKHKGTSGCQLNQIGNGAFEGNDNLNLLKIYTNPLVYKSSSTIPESVTIVYYYWDNTSTATNYEKLSEWLKTYTRTAIDFSDNNNITGYWYGDIGKYTIKITDNKITLTISATSSIDMPDYNLLTKDYTYTKGTTTITVRPKEAPWYKYRNIVDRLEITGANVKSIGNYAFYGFDSLDELNISAGNIERIGDFAFAGCSNIATYQYGKNVLKKIGTCAFLNCESLVTGVFGAHKTNSTISVGLGAFQGCTSLKNLTIYGAASTVKANKENGKYVDTYTTTLMNDNQDVINGTCTIEDEAIVYVNHKDTSGVGNLETYVKDLNKAYFYLDTVGSEKASEATGTSGGIIWVINGKNTVFNKTLLIKIKDSGTTPAMPDYTLQSNQAPWRKYANVISQIKVNKEISHIGDYAFYGLYNAKTVYLLNYKSETSSLTSIGDYAFADCTSLISINENKKGYINKSMTTIGNGAFANCKNLHKYMFYSKLKSIGNQAFYIGNLADLEGFSESTSDSDESGESGGDSGESGGDSEEEVLIPDEGDGETFDDESFTLEDGDSDDDKEDETTDGIQIINLYGNVDPHGSFQGLTSITTLNIYQGVTKIYDYEFKNCTSLSKVSIGSGVSMEEIGTQAFFGCKKLAGNNKENGTFNFNFVNNVFNKITKVGKYAFRFGGIPSSSENYSDDSDEASTISDLDTYSSNVNTESDEPTVSITQSVVKEDNYYPTKTEAKNAKTSGLAQVNITVDASNSKTDAGQDFVIVIDTKKEVMKQTINVYHPERVLNKDNEKTADKLYTKMDLAKETSCYLVEQLLNANSNNRIALVTINSGTKILDDFTDDENTLLTDINCISGTRNNAGTIADGKAATINNDSGLTNATRTIMNLIASRGADSPVWNKGAAGKIGAAGNAERNCYVIFVHSGYTKDGKETDLTSAESAMLNGATDETFVITLGERIVESNVANKYNTYGIYQFASKPEYYKSIYKNIQDINYKIPESNQGFSSDDLIEYIGTSGNTFDYIYDSTENNNIYKKITDTVDAFFDDIRVITSSCVQNLKVSLSVNTKDWDLYKYDATQDVTNEDKVSYLWSGNITQGSQDANGNTVITLLAGEAAALDIENPNETTTTDKSVVATGGTNNFSFYVKLKDSYKNSLTEYMNEDDSRGSAPLNGISASYTVLGGLSDGEEKVMTASTGDSDDNNNTITSDFPTLGWNTRQITVKIQNDNNGSPKGSFKDSNNNSVTELTYSRTYDTEITLPTPIPADGYVFTGWKVTRDTSKSEQYQEDYDPANIDGTKNMTYKFGITSAVIEAQFKWGDYDLYIDPSGTPKGQGLNEADATLKIGNGTTINSKYKVKLLWGTPRLIFSSASSGSDFEGYDNVIGKPYLRGYTFQGWAVSSAKENVGLGTTSLVSDNKPAVTYNDNSLMSTTTPSNSYYMFNTSSMTYIADNKISDSERYSYSQTVTAQWSPKTFKVNLDVNDGYTKPGNETSKGELVTTSINVIYNSSQNNTLSNQGGTIPSKVGYIFQGWYDARTGGNQVYNEKGEHINNTGYWLNNLWYYNTDTTNSEGGYDLILYAHWKPITYTIRYHGNKHWQTSATLVNGTDYYEQVNIEYDTDFNMETCKFSRNDGSTVNGTYYVKGYQFIGWGTNSGYKSYSTLKLVQLNSSYCTDLYNTKCKDKTINLSPTNIANVINTRNLSSTQGAVIDLYALWKKQITLTFNMNKGYYQGSTSPVTLSSWIYNDQYTYTFNITGGLTGNTVSNTGGSQDLQTNVIDAYGESNSDGLNSKYTYSVDGVQYRFLGWNHNSSSKEPESIYSIIIKDNSGNSKTSHDTTITLHDNDTLYAIWEPVLQVKMSIARTLGPLAFSNGSVPNSSTNQISESNATNYISVIIKPGEQGYYNAETASKNVTLSVKFENSFTKIYDNKNAKWYDTLNPNTDEDTAGYRVENGTKVYNQNSGLNRTIKFDKLMQRSFYVPQYLGTSQSYDGNAGVKKYLTEFTFTSSEVSYFYNKKLGVTDAHDTVSVVANIYLDINSGSDPVPPSTSADSILNELKTGIVE